jgi:hypothetical protein
MPIASTTPTPHLQYGAARSPATHFEVRLTLDHDDPKFVQCGVKPREPKTAG